MVATTLLRVQIEPINVLKCLYTLIYMETR
jgi:hypothetical protein